MIDEALARRLIDSQFPEWSDLPITKVELDGWDNRTFRLGSELTIRLPTGDWYAKQVAKETGATANQVVLAWLIGGELPIVPLIGASSVAQLDESLAAVDLQLSAEQRQLLDAAD